MKFNVYLFGRKYWFRVDRNPYYKSRRAIRRANKYWAQFPQVEKAREVEVRKFDASEQSWS